MPTFFNERLRSVNDSSPEVTTITTSDFTRACDIAKANLGEFEMVRVGRTFLRDDIDPNLRTIEPESTEETVL